MIIGALEGLRGMLRPDPALSIRELPRHITRVHFVHPGVRVWIGKAYTHGCYTDLSGRHADAHTLDVSIGLQFFFVVATGRLLCIIVASRHFPIYYPRCLAAVSRPATALLS